MPEPLEPKSVTPLDELDLLHRVAMNDTDQSRSCRYLLFLLVGGKEPTGFIGQGLLELRKLDREVAEAYLKVSDWWSCPTKAEKRLYSILRELERLFLK